MLTPLVWLAQCRGAEQGLHPNLWTRLGRSNCCERHMLAAPVYGIHDGASLLYKVPNTIKNYIATISRDSNTQKVLHHIFSVPRNHLKSQIMGCPAWSHEEVFLCH